MRLTLRTMLAYLDDVLDPSDAEALGKKIDESEFASRLVHRIRTSMKKLRLGAPKLEGKGMGLDANTVSEYLDSTLSSDRVPDFEKVCLESDVHLAETAACHQVLTTLVLGEPALVDPEVKERIYRIGIPGVHAAPPSLPTPDGDGRHVGSAASETRPKQSSGPPPIDSVRNSDSRAKPGESEKATPAKPEIPDYLRAGRRPQWVTFALIALVVFLVCSTAFLAIGPSRIAGIFGGGDNGQKTAQKKTTKKKRDRPAPSPAPRDKSGANSNGQSDDGTPDDADDTNGKTPPVAPEEGTGRSGNGNTTVNGEPDKSNGGKVDDPPVPVPPTPMVTPPANDTSTDKMPPDDPMNKPLDVVPDDTVKPVPETTTIGQYVSEQQVLARIDSKTKSWYRVPPAAAISVTDHFLALPTYQPQIALKNGLQVRVTGPAEFKFHPTAEANGRHLEIFYGKAVIDTVDRPGEKIHLDLAGRKGIATFADADSRLAIEVQHYKPPGANPELSPFPGITIIDVWSVRGRIIWQDGEVPQTLEAGEVVRYLGKEPSKKVALGIAPKWVDSDPRKLIDMYAAEALKMHLDPKRPLVITLEELVGHADVEVRMLAARCLMYFGPGNFEPFVLMMNLDDRDAIDENKSYWQDHFEATQDAIARSPESAAEVRKAFEKTRGEDAEPLYRMLWGYSPKQITEGADAKLVESLKSPQLDFRVLAILNLKKITGGMTLKYRPDYPPSRSTRTIRDWNKKLADGEVVYAKPPGPPALPDPVEPPRPPRK